MNQTRNTTSVQHHLEKQGCYTIEKSLCITTFYESITN